LTFADYKEINLKQSSELFISIMRVLLDSLPCTQNFYILKKKYVRAYIKNKSPKVKALASPKLCNGLGLHTKID
jgi:hypothetical protein